VEKFIKIRGNLTKFWQKQKYTVFWDTVYYLMTEGGRSETSLHIYPLLSQVNMNFFLKPANL